MEDKNTKNYELSNLESKKKKKLKHVLYVNGL